MVNQQRITAGLVIVLVILSILHQSADAVTIDTVPVGNPGNAAENTGFGSVGYNYRIGKTEVTNAQYDEFLNGVDATGANALALYNSFMSSDALGGINFNGGAANGSKYEIKPGRDNNPVVLVSWYDSIRFADWLHNGQGAGSTEDGAYTLLGGTSTPTNGLSITRNAGAKWWLPSEDEWYKAAYHKNDGVTETIGITRPRPTPSLTATSRRAAARQTCRILRTSSRTTASPTAMMTATQ